VAEDCKFDTFGDGSCPFIVLLTQPSEISGTGELAVFTFRAEAEGIAQFSIAEAGLILARRGGDADEWESAGDLTVIIGDAKIEDASLADDQMTSSSGGGSGGSMLLTEGCCDANPPYPCTGFMQKDSARGTGTPAINILDLITVRDGFLEQRDTSGHFPTRMGTASDLDESGTVNLLDELWVRNNLNKVCADLGAIEIVEVVFTLKDDEGEPIGSPRILGAPQTWDTEYWALDQSFYLTEDVNLEIKITMNAPIAAKDFEVRWVQLEDDGQGNPVRVPSQERPAFEIENDTSPTGPEFFTYNSDHTITLTQVITGDLLDPGDFATLTMDTFSYTGSADPVSRMIDGPTICVHQRPHLVSAIAKIAGEASLGFRQNDVLVLTFDQPTNEYSFTGSNIEETLILPEGHEWGTVTDVDWTYDDVLEIAFGGGSHSVAIGDWIGIESGTIKDSADQFEAIGDSIRIIPQPSIIWAEAIPAAGPIYGIQTGDIVRIWFNFPTNQYDITPANIADVLLLKDEAVTKDWGTVVSASWFEVDGGYCRLDIVLSETGGSDIKPGYTITIAADTIKDASGSVDASDAPAQIAGTFGEPPRLVSICATDAGSHAPGIQAGDQVILRFDGPTNAYDFVNMSLDDVLILDEGEWGDVSITWTTVAWEDDCLVIEFLEANSTIEEGDTVEFCSYDPIVTIMDPSEEAYAEWPDPAPAIEGGFGPAPHLISARAGDYANHQAGIQSMDEVVIQFNNSTNAPSITWQNIDSVLDLSGDHSWGGETGIDQVQWMTSVWENDTLRIVFTEWASSTVAIGDSITIAPATIYYPGTTYEATGSPPNITGDFGSAPMILEARAGNGGSDQTGIQEGDTLTLVFDRPTNELAITSDNIDCVLWVEGKTWGAAYYSCTWYTMEEGGKTYYACQIDFADGDHEVTEGDWIFL